MLWTQRKKKCKTKKTETHARISCSIEEVSRIYREEANLNGSRICQGFIGQTESFWWIEKLSRSYRDKVQKARWIEIVLTSIETRRKGGLIDSNLSRGVQKLLRNSKTVFQRREKYKYKCNQACYSTKDLNSILSSQKHFSTKILSTMILKTHIHTKHI